MSALAAPLYPERSPVGAESNDRKAAFERLRAELSVRRSAVPIESLLPTAIPELDRLLSGGFPAGTVATLEGEAGCWSLAAGLVAQFTRRGLVAILDDGGLYPPALAEAGVPLERVMVVPARTALAMARAADILLRSRICRLVLMPAVTLRDAVWERLAKLAHRSSELCIAVRKHKHLAAGGSARVTSVSP
jgi:hypothetical protein